MSAMGLGAFVSGFGTGYSFTRDQQRRDELEKQEKEKYASEKDARDRELAWKAGRDQIRNNLTTDPLYQDVDGVQVEIGRRPKQMSFTDNLKLVEQMSAHDFQHGKMGVMDYKSAGDAVRQMKAEGFLDAHQAFVETGSIKKAAEKFNEVGDKKVDPDSLKAKEIDGPFGKHVVYSGKYADGEDFEYDPVRAAAMAGGAKGFLAMTEAAGKADREKRATEVKADEVARKDLRDAELARLKDRELGIKEKEVDEVKKIRALAYAEAKRGTGKFEFKPVDQARLASQIARRMQIVDPVSNKEVDHEATSDAIALAGDIVRRSGGQIGIDEAVGLVAKPSYWMTEKEAKDQALRDYGRMSKWSGGVEVKDDKGKVAKKLTKEEYLKARAQELVEENRQKISDRVSNYMGAGSGLKVIGRGLPRDEAPAADAKGGAAAGGIPAGWSVTER
jgi:hypothetical protein